MCVFGSHLWARRRALRRCALFLVVLAKRSHPIPSRTRSLSSSAPMVLHDFLCGRVGRRQGPLCSPSDASLGLFYFRSGLGAWGGWGGLGGLWWARFIGARHVLSARGVWGIARCWWAWRAPREPGGGGALVRLVPGGERLLLLSLIRRSPLWGAAAFMDGVYRCRL